MSSVFSKLIDKTSSKCGIRQERLTKGVVGVLTTLYLLKIGYPYIAGTARWSRSKVFNSTKKKVDEDEDGVKERRLRRRQEVDGKENKNGKKPTVGLDRAFVKQLIALLRIMIPGWRTREAGLLTCATFALLTRTFLSVYVATLEGQIVKRIVLKDVRGFFLMLARWFAIAFPATFVNSAIRYLEGRLALSFR